MLKTVHIENYAIIEKVDIDFFEGFSVITGETGAGKSILIGALNLILGQRCDSQVLFDKSKKCIVEAVFSIKDLNLEEFFTVNELDYEDITFIRREISANGKSRAFINDTPVNLNTLKELSENLIDIHSQHKILDINESNFQMAIIDSYCKNNDVLKEYKKEFNAYNKLKQTLNELIEIENKAKADKDYFEFQFNELEEANLKTKELTEIENEIKLLSNSEEIKSTLNKILYLINSGEINLLTMISEIKLMLAKISDYDESISTLKDRIESTYIEFKDIANEIEISEQKVNHDPQKIEILNERLNTIYHLLQKHRAKDVDELIDIKNGFEEKLLNINTIDIEIEKATKLIEEKNRILIILSNTLSGNRKKVFNEIEKRIIEILTQVGMPKSQFKIVHETVENFTSNGTDKICFMFNSNVGGELKEISKIASGGELSRLMLTVKSIISESNILPTIIFDEIDIGISGEVAKKVGMIMKSMSKNMQVISITHLPQIAASGENHYFVYKDNDTKITRTHIKMLKSDERIYEIAKMLSEENPSLPAIENAKQLLNIN